jgi:hypothetical protein
LQKAGTDFASDSSKDPLEATIFAHIDLEMGIKMNLRIAFVENWLIHNKESKLDGDVHQLIRYINAFTRKGRYNGCQRCWFLPTINDRGRELY